MSRTRARAPQALAIAAAALALASSFGGSALAASRASIHHAAASAQQAPAIATSVRWHRLTLRNGWASSQSQYGSGDPAVAIQRGIVYLSGSMHQASGTSEWFATLPRGFRPAHNLWLPVYSFQGTEGSIRIAASGQMFAFGGDVTAYASLAGISYPVTSVRMHNLGLVSGWTSVPSMLGGKPTAGIQNGIVYLTGAIQQPSGTNTHFATLPRALRPAHNLWLPIFTAPGVIGSIEIAHNGQMFAFGIDAHNYAGLAGISFPVNS